MVGALPSSTVHKLTRSPESCCYSQLSQHKSFRTLSLAPQTVLPRHRSVGLFSCLLVVLGCVFFSPQKSQSASVQFCGLSQLRSSSLDIILQKLMYCRHFSRDWTRNPFTVGSWRSKKRSRAAGCWRADSNSSGSTRQGQCTPMAADNNTV